MPPLLSGARATPAETPPTSVQLEVCSRRRSRLRRRWAGRIVAGLVAFCALAFVLPPAFGLSRYTVTDDAMSGTMERGSVVFAKSQPVVDLEVGDIITYRVPTGAGGELVTRRIVDIKSGVIRTSRDSTGAIDPWTLSSDEMTHDRAVVDIPYAGYAYDAILRAGKSAWDLLPR